jgi:hypothetical protein
MTHNTTAMTFTRTADWLLALWKKIDDKTFGNGFDCLAEHAICRLGVAQRNGREAIRENLRAFIDTGFTALMMLSSIGTADRSKCSGAP